MKGRILDFTINKSEGIILGEDGNRYYFSFANWLSNNFQPQKDLKVDFVAKEDKATDIYVVEQDNIYTTNGTQQQISAAAIISLIFGILAISGGWWVLAIPDIIAIVFGHIARANIKRSNGKLGGDGIAVGGLILGYISLSAYIVFIGLFIGFFGFLG